MAENESLDLGSSYAQRWNPAFTSIQQGDPCEQTAPKVSKALYGGVRKAIKQFQEHGVKLSDLLDARNSPQRLRQLVRQTGGHPYAELVESAAHANGHGVKECLFGWAEAILDKMCDQMLLHVAENDDSRTFFDLKECTDRVREIIAPDVEHLVNSFTGNPDWRPQRKPGRADGQLAASPTEELMGMSLLGAKQP